MSVRRRSSTGSSSSASASSSMCCSTAQQTCGAVGARIEPGGLVVRVDERRLDVHVLDHVRPAGVHGRHLGEEAALAAVGAAVEDEAAAAGHERPVAAGAGLELDHHPLAAVVGRDELLLAREDELHRAARPRARARPRGPRSGSRTWSRSRRRAAGRRSARGTPGSGGRARRRPWPRREPASSSRP